MAISNTDTPNGREATTQAGTTVTDNSNSSQHNDTLVNSKTTTPTVSIHRDVSVERTPFWGDMSVASGTNNGGQQSNNQYNYRERRNSTGGITGTQPNPSRPNRQQRERTNSIRGNSDTRSTLKFVGDFDFEKSNAEFDKNAIEDEIKKSLSIKPTKENDDESSNVDKEKEAGKENVQDNEQESTEASLSKLDQPQGEVNPDGYYDKQKSFFDRISCETTEKEKT